MSSMAGYTALDLAKLRTRQVQCPYHLGRKLKSIYV